MDQRELPVYEALERMQIPYRRFEHRPADTMEDCRIIDEDIVAALAAELPDIRMEHCKNLFLCNRQGTEFFLLLLGGEKKFRTARISRQIDRPRLSFATPEQLLDKLGLYPGAVTPMGLLCPNAKDVNVLLDADVAKAEWVLVHPNVNTASVLLRGSDLLRFLSERGNPLQTVQVDAD